MCVVLKSDFIVGLTVKNKVEMHNLFGISGPVCISIDDCMRMQENCKRCSCGNVIAMSVRDEFKYYFQENPQFFKQCGDGKFEVLVHNLGCGQNDEIDYEKFLYLGVYNSFIMKSFDYPITKVPITR